MFTLLGSRFSVRVHVRFCVRGSGFGIRRSAFGVQGSELRSRSRYRIVPFMRNLQLWRAAAAAAGVAALAFVFSGQTSAQGGVQAPRQGQGGAQQAPPQGQGGAARQGGGGPGFGGPPAPNPRQKDFPYPVVRDQRGCCPAGPRALPSPPLAAGPWTWQTTEANIKVSIVARGIEHPYAMAFMDDGAILVTERIGRLRVIRNGVLDPTPAAPNLPPM